MPKILMKIFQVIVKVFKNCKVEGNHLEKIVFQVIPQIYHNLDFLSEGIFSIRDKVSVNFGSEVSYVYILSGQKLIKNAQNGPFWRFLSL